VKAHYVDPAITAKRLAALGAPNTAMLLREHLPTRKEARSGDLGEVLARLLGRIAGRLDSDRRRMVERHVRRTVDPDLVGRALRRSVDTVFAAIDLAEPGEILVPDVPAALVVHIAEALIDGRDIATVVTGIRPGEKTHEIMISEEEAPRTVRRDRWIAIRPMLPELLGDVTKPVVTGEFSSATDLMDLDTTKELLRSHDLMVDHQLGPETELLR